MLEALSNFFYYNFIRNVIYNVGPSYVWIKLISQNMKLCDSWLRRKIKGKSVKQMIIENQLVIHFEDQLYMRYILLD